MGKGKKMITLRELKEKAVSKQQQKLMGLALAYKRGEAEDSEVSDTVKDLAKSMSTKELEDFASTKHKGLPQKKEDNNISNRSAAMKPQTYNDPKTGKKKVRMVPVNTNIVKTNDRVDEAFKKGDVVKVNLGPHKHLKHEVIHAFDDGTYNIKPYDLAPSKNRYRGGAVKVKSNQIKKLDEEMDPTKHVSKKGDMYCVYNKDGEEVAKFDNKKDADAYAIKNHDKLMEYLEVGTDAIRKSYASMTPGQTNELSTGADRAAAAVATGIATYGVKKAIDRFRPTQVAKARREREAKKQERDDAIEYIRKQRDKRLKKLRNKK